MRKVLLALLVMVCVCLAYIMPQSQDSIYSASIAHTSGYLIGKKYGIITINDSLISSNKALFNDINIKIQDSNNIILRISIVITVIKCGSEIPKAVSIFILQKFPFQSTNNHGRSI
jgi:hypothetical protein